MNTSCVVWDFTNIHVTDTKNTQTQIIGGSHKISINYWAICAVKYLLDNKWEPKVMYLIDDMEVIAKPFCTCRAGQLRSLRLRSEASLSRSPSTESGAVMGGRRDVKLRIMNSSFCSPSSANVNTDSPVTHYNK